MIKLNEEQKKQAKEALAKLNVIAEEHGEDALRHAYDFRGNINSTKKDIEKSKEKLVELNKQIE